MNDSTNRPENTELSELEQRELDLQLLALLPELKSYTIYCSYTGVPVATMQLIQQWGKLPYLANWKDNAAAHPLFSLPRHQLLGQTRKHWNALFRNSSDRATRVQKEQFQVAFVAILHSLGSIKQDTPVLPEFHTVASNMQRLLELAYWLHFLQSKRFAFPTLRINKLNNNTVLHDINNYFDVCDEKRADYTKSKDARAEDAKLRAADRAEKAVRAGHMRAISKKALWNWFIASIQEHAGKKFQLPEWQEWREDSEKLWFGSENQQLQYSLDDCDSIADVLITNCELGTIVSHAFRTELEKIRKHISNHLQIFEIDWTATLKPSVQRTDALGNVLGEQSRIEDTPPEKPAEQAPQPHEFATRILFLKAEAKWKIMKLQYDAWMEKYGKQPPAQQDDMPDDDEGDAE